MPTKTLLIVGPGCIGKSPLDKGLKPDVVRIDPYRLRHAGPRDSQDVFYAPEKLKPELEAIFQANSMPVVELSKEVLWCQAAKTLFLKVRADWQVLFLGNLPDSPAKAEIYAPCLPTMLANSEVRRAFGDLFVLVLNPVEKLLNLSDFTSLQAATRKNCKDRKDDEESVEKRVKTVPEEAAEWCEMIQAGALEYENWPFPECVYAQQGFAETLKKAVHAIVTRFPQLKDFFKDVSEL